MKKISLLLLCGLFAVFLAFSFGYFVGNNSRDFVVLKGENADGLWPVAVAPAQADISPVHINSATKEQLMELPGIGERYAEEILALRDKLGKLESVWDLDVIPGIGEAKIAQLAPYTVFD